MQLRKRLTGPGDEENSLAHLLVHSVLSTAITATPLLPSRDIPTQSPQTASHSPGFFQVPTIQTQAAIQALSPYN
ncbi:hypothetical protein H671_21597, partial [Cricetulus griseus]